VQAPPQKPIPRFGGERKDKPMRAVISVTGRDAIGIIHKVSEKCAEAGANISEISQTVLDEFFAMIMLVNIDGLTVPFGDFVDMLAGLGKENHLEIHTMHEDIFSAMHKI
jgi:ACT domain-containing protein